LNSASNLASYLELQGLGFRDTAYSTQAVGFFFQYICQEISLV
jgi:hypothetical protein